MDLIKALNLQEKDVKDLTSLTENLMKYEKDEQVIIKFVKLLSDTQMLVYVLDDVKNKVFKLKKVWLKSKIKYFIDEQKIKEGNFYLIIYKGLERMKGKKNTFHNFDIKELSLNEKDFTFIE